MAPTLPFNFAVSVTPDASDDPLRHAGVLHAD